MYKRQVYDLFQKGVLGADPLGLGYDQALSLFLNKQAGLMIDNSMGLDVYKRQGLTRSNKLTNMKLQRIDVLLNIK